MHRHDGERFHCLSIAEGLGGGGVIGLSVDRRGAVWGGSTSGVFRREGSRFVPFVPCR